MRIIWNGKKNRALSEVKSRNNGIQYALTFPPEHFAAAVQILSYFGAVLRSKFPQSNSAITITQESDRLIMRIEPGNSEPEVIEVELEKYGKLLRGDMTVERFTDDVNLARLIERQMTQAAEWLEWSRINRLQLNADSGTSRKLFESAFEHGKSSDCIEPELHKPISGIRTGMSDQSVGRGVRKSVGASASGEATDELWISMSFQLIQHSILLMINSVDSSSFPMPRNLGKMVGSPRYIMPQLEDIKNRLNAIDVNDLRKSDLRKSGGLVALHDFLISALDANSFVSKVITKVPQCGELVASVSAHYNRIAMLCGMVLLPREFKSKLK